MVSVFVFCCARHGKAIKSERIDKKEVLMRLILFHDVIIINWSYSSANNFCHCLYREAITIISVSISISVFGDYIIDQCTGIGVKQVHQKIIFGRYLRKIAFLVIVGIIAFVGYIIRAI